jgi:hypothetical protein
VETNPATLPTTGSGPSRTSKRGVILLISPTGSDLLRTRVPEVPLLPRLSMEGISREESWTNTSELSESVPWFGAADSFPRDGGVGRRTSGPAPS